MRIVVITDLYPPMIGGVPTITHELALDLSNRGHQVWVIAPSDQARTVRESVRNLHIHRFASFEWPTYANLRIALLPVARIYALIRQIQPDVVHIHSLLTLGQLGRMLGSAMNIPVIGTNHYLPLNLSASLHASALSKPFNALTYSYIVSFFNSCDLVTAPTSTAIDLLKSRGLKAPAKVISNGIRLTKFAGAHADSALLSSLDLPTNVPLLLHVNRLSKEKRIDVAIAAMRHVNYPARLVIVGDGPEQQQLAQQVRDMRLENRVTFCGPVASDTLAALYAASSLFLIASEGELQSIATMDAMLAGLPVIAANAVALPELVRDGRNGALFPPGDSTACASAINRLLADEHLRKRMGRASKQFILTHDRERILDQWEALYQEARIVSRRKQTSSFGQGRPRISTLGEISKIGKRM
jgi:glycosyltransferase involved in cell wall biosynthesis